MQKIREKKMIKIIIGTATCGNAAGAQDILLKIKELSKDKHDIQVSETGCIGMCFKEPILQILSDNTHYVYGNVTPGKYF